LFEKFRHKKKLKWQFVKSIKQTKGYKVTFTGHSLGAALASLASMRAAVEGLVTDPDRLTLYTFGQPRVGCSVFAFKHDELVPNRYRLFKYNVFTFIKFALLRSQGNPIASSFM
jgi:predicted lipase